MSAWRSRRGGGPLPPGGENARGDNGPGTGTGGSSDSIWNRGRGQNRGHAPGSSPSSRGDYNRGRGNGRGRGGGSGGVLDNGAMRAAIRTGTGRLAPDHGDAQKSKRHFELIASVSRSSGLEKDGDALKNFRTQEEYRAFIDDKYRTLCALPPLTDSTLEGEVRQRKELQENLLILFRKLREGISSSKRNDSFALEVYETSLYLSLIYDLPRHTSAIIPHLLPEVYLSCPPPASPEGKAQHLNAPISSLLSVLYHITASYPSQLTASKHLATIPSSLFPTDSVEYQWVKILSQNLRRRNFYQFERMTRREEIHKALFAPSASSSDDTQTTSQYPSRPLAKQAIYSIARRLRVQTRQTTWPIIRAAYRELWLSYFIQDPDLLQQDVKGTRAWLSDVLCFAERSDSGGYQDGIDRRSDGNLGEWMREQAETGSVRPKEGAGNEGRWVVFKMK